MKRFIMSLRHAGPWSQAEATGLPGVERIEEITGAYGLYRVTATNEGVAALKATIPRVMIEPVIDYTR